MSEKSATLALMPSCSICERPQAAAIVNEMLAAKNGLDAIASATGFHRSSVHRHSKKCFPTWRALQLRARRGKNDGEPGRMIVKWPEDWPDGAGYTHYGERIPASDLRPNDVLIVVNFEKTPVANLGNPRACTLSDDDFAEFLALALAEDAERAELAAKQETAS